MSQVNRFLPTTGSRIKWRRWASRPGVSEVNATNFTLPFISCRVSPCCDIQQLHLPSLSHPCRCYLPFTAHCTVRAPFPLVPISLSEVFTVMLHLPHRFSLLSRSTPSFSAFRPLPGSAHFTQQFNIPFNDTTLNHTLLAGLSNKETVELGND